MGLQTDLKLVGDDYQWLGSLFYFGTFKSPLREQLIAGLY